MEIKETFVINQFSAKRPDDDGERGRYSTVNMSVHSVWTQTQVTHLFSQAKAFNNVLKYLYDKDSDVAVIELQHFSVKPLFKRCNFSLTIPRTKKDELIELKDCKISGQVKLSPEKQHLFGVEFKLKHGFVNNQIVEKLADLFAKES